MDYTITHLRQLEAESIQIMREVAAEFRRPVMMYSVGKDSSVMLHLARKAFHPGSLPFPLLHVDTTWEFREMITFRDQTARDLGLDLKVWTNPQGKSDRVTPFTHGADAYTRIMKTEALKQALDHYEFDAAFGGARRDEEKLRANERVFSFRDEHHHWEPRNQRPELWSLYNTRVRPGESIRVFPLSDWTELDIWLYIMQEEIPIVPLYFAAKRPVVGRNGSLILVDDERLQLGENEIAAERMVRFRTLGCYPLTGAMESTATTVPEIVEEMLVARTSERQCRVSDHGDGDSMEAKKRDGYF
jgi:sulfate adenylyltransferase subunit 2